MKLFSKDFFELDYTNRQMKGLLDYSLINILSVNILAPIFIAYILFDKINNT